MNPSVLAAVLLVGASVASLFGYNVLPEDQASLAANLTAMVGGAVGVLAVLKHIRDSKPVEPPADDNSKPEA
jgi:hypothetical protein